MPIPGVLVLEPFNRSTVDETHPEGVITEEAAFDLPGLVILRDPPATSMPGGGEIRIKQKIASPRATADDAGLQALIANALSGSVSGIRELVVNDDSIETPEQAQQRADSELVTQTTWPIDLSFDTYSSGVEPGERCHLSHSATGVDHDTEIIDITSRIDTQADSPTGVIHSVQCATLPPMTMDRILAGMLRKIVRPPKRAPVKVTY